MTPWLATWGLHHSRPLVLALGFERVHRRNLQHGDELLDAPGVVEPGLVTGELLLGQEPGDGLAVDRPGPLDVGAVKGGGSPLHAQAALPQRIRRTTTLPGSTPSILPSSSARPRRVASQGLFSELDLGIGPPFPSLRPSAPPIPTA